MPRAYSLFVVPLLFQMLLSNAEAAQQAPPAPAANQSKQTSDSGAPAKLALKADEENTLESALALYNHSRFHAAQRALQTLAKTGGSDAARANAWLARCYLQNNLPKEARAAAETALVLDKSLPTVQSAMGEVLYREARLNEAEEIFRKLASDKNIRDPRAMLGLARLYRATANHKSAFLLLDSAHMLAPDDPDIFWEWVYTLNRKDKILALQAHHTETENPDDSDKTDKRGSEVHPEMLTVLEDLEKNPQRTCKLKNPKEGGTIKLISLLSDASHIRGYGLSVGINEANSKLLVDTGASGILINSRIAQKAGVEKLFDNSVGGIGDKQAANGYLGVARSIRIGDFEFENCYISVVEKKSSLGEDGLIGADVFAHFLVDLDFTNNKLVLSALPPFPDAPMSAASLEPDQTAAPVRHNRFIPEEYKDFERFYRIGHDILLPTQINKVPNRLFLVDTGAFDNTITPAAAKEASKLYHDSDITVKGLSGEVKDVFSTGDVELTFSHFKQRRHDLVAFDLKSISDSDGMEVSGILGFAMLWMLETKIDYRDNLIEFKYKLPYN